MLNSLLDGSSVNIFIAFFAGVVSFFASCLVPLVPIYLAYLSGISLNTKNAINENKRTIVGAALFFVLGFILTFIILSLAITQLSIWFESLHTIITYLAGALFILLGLFILGIFKSPFLGTEHKISTANIFSRYKNVHAFITGSAFGFGWSPCIGPVLAVILFFTSREMMFEHGVIMLTSYGIGLGLPFLIIALGFEKFMPYIKKFEKASAYLNTFSGIIILLTGVLLLTGQLQNISAYFLRIMNLHFSAL